MVLYITVRNVDFILSSIYFSRVKIPYIIYHKKLEILIQDLTELSDKFLTPVMEDKPLEVKPILSPISDYITAPFFFFTRNLCLE